MISIPAGTKAILLDLGGVLLQLHLDKTFAAFRQLGFENFHQHFDSYCGSAFIEDFEEGKLSEQEFIAMLKRQCHPETTTAQVLDAWNAMLGELPTANLMVLQEWKKQYPLFLYSNTNALHVAHLHRYYNSTFGENSVQNCFSKIYYSHELGIRKPHKEGFLAILEEQQLRPDEVFYIDDGNMHIDAAQSIGIQSVLWTKNRLLSVR